MSEKSAGEAERDVTGRPRRVAVAALLCGLQGAVIAVLGAVMLVLAVTGDPDDVTQAVTGSVTVLVLSVLPLAAGHGLWRLRRWSRGPAVIVQLLALPVAGTLFGSGGMWALTAAALVVTAVAVLGCLINPTATEALGVGPQSTGRAGPRVG